MKDNKHNANIVSTEELRILLKELRPVEKNATSMFLMGPKLEGFRYAPEMIYFDQITNLDVEISSLLSPFRRQLSLRNVAEADLESIKKLMEAKVGAGSLSSKYYEFGCLELGIETLDAPRASILNRIDGHLSLPNLKKIDPKAAVKLSGISWTLLLGIETIDPETATALVDLPKKSMGRSLHLPNLKQCDTESLRILASVAPDYAKSPSRNADLVLGFEEIEIEQALILSSRRSNGYDCRSLPRLRKGSVEFFTLVGNSWEKDRFPTLNPIYFNSLEMFNAQEAEALVPRVRADNFALNGLKQLDPGVAEQLSKYRPSDFEFACLRLDGLQSLTQEDAEHLGKLRDIRYLSLDGLQNINAGVAAGLANFPGVLCLNGVKCISDETARELAKQGGLIIESKSTAGGRLQLNGLTELSDRAAEELSAYKGECLNLDGLKEISASAAQSLAKYQGDLKLKRSVKGE